MTFYEAMEELSREDRFRATIYAMNTLLVQKGVYSPEEFERYFSEWASKHGICKQIKTAGIRCSRPAHFNGFCAYHRKKGKS